MKYKKNRTQNEPFIVYGLNGCLSILDSSSCTIKKIIILDNFKKENPETRRLLKKHNSKLTELSSQIFNEEYHMYRTQGIIIYFTYELLDSFPHNENNDNECYLILDSIKDPQNLGQIIRTS